MEKHLKISFDFDGTLEDEFGELTKNEQKEFIQSLAKKYKNLGHDVMILTKRYGPESPYKLAKELGMDKVYFTNREMKFSYIIRMGIDVHFENDEYEVQLINQVCSERNHKCLVLSIGDSNWRNLINHV